MNWKEWVLAKDGVVLLDVDDLNALLAGRRTDMLRLEHLELDGVHIEALDAKVFFCAGLRMDKLNYCCTPSIVNRRCRHF